MKNAVIIIPFHLPWEWSADFMRQTANCLSRNNYVFCYLAVEPIHFKQLVRNSSELFYLKKISKNLWIYRPINIIPFERFQSVRILNGKISLAVFQLLVAIKLFSYKPSKKILWIFNCKFHNLTHNFFKDYIVLYDCVDYVWDPDVKTNLDLRNQENDLIAHCSVVTVNSHSLYKIHKNKRKDIHVVPQGFRMHEFDISLKETKITNKYHKPIIGLVGVINYRIDFQLLYELAKQNPQWNFMLWGYKDTILYNDLFKVEENINKLTSLPNIIFGKSRTSEETYSMIQSFDICMIPYNAKLSFNKYCFPMKLFEYFYMGKPVVSTPIEELKRFPTYVKIDATAIEWENHIKELLSHLWSDTYKKEQKKLAEENSWEKKIQMIASHV